MLGLEECVLEESRPESADPSVWRREEDARDIDDVTGGDTPREVTVEMDRHGAGDMTDGNLVGLDVSERSRGIRQL